MRNFDQDLSQGRDEIIGEAFNIDSSADQFGKLPGAAASWLRIPKTARALPGPLTPGDDRAPRLQDDATPRKRNREVIFEDDGTRPALRRLVDLAHKAIAVFPNLNTEKTAQTLQNYLSRKETKA